MQESYIDTPERLEWLCDALRQSCWLALDTEFMREKSYFPQLCLLQICDGRIAACIDPLRLEQLDPLMDILLNPDTVKVFHAGRQDLEMFSLMWQRLPAPLFDTQLAATLLGLGEQIGYANLVQKLLGIELTKEHTRTDWSQRPLQPGQLRYALDDVIYLGQIYIDLRDQLIDLGRGDWLQEEFALLADPATYKFDPDKAWQKIRGRLRLKGVQLAVLQRLTAWREELAAESNCPKRWIVKDDVLVDLARQMPKTMADMERIRGLDQAVLKQHGELMLGRIAAARLLPQASWPREKQPPMRPGPEQNALIDLLMCCLRLLAEQNRITPAMLANRAVLEQMVAGERDLDLLRGWRRRVAGDRLLEVLEGRIAPQFVEGRLQLVETAEETNQSHQIDPD